MINSTMSLCKADSLEVVLQQLTSGVSLDIQKLQLGLSKQGHGEAKVHTSCWISD